MAGNKLTLSFSCDSYTAEWPKLEGGKTAGKPDANNLAAIRKIEQLAEAHEMKHNTVTETVCNEWKAKPVEVTLTNGQNSQDVVTKYSNDFKEARKAACLMLHSMEGHINIVQGTNPTVTMMPQGPQGCN
jgi:hypothetical protein